MNVSKWHWMIALCGFLLMLVAPAQAHHSVASEYNVKQLTPMTGVLEKLELVKPHPWMFVDVKAADGSVQTWQLEFSLRWRPSSMVIGQSYKMIVMPARYTKQKAFIVELTFPDGTKFSRAS